MSTEEKTYLMSIESSTPVKMMAEGVHAAVPGEETPPSKCLSNADPGHQHTAMGNGERHDPADRTSTTGNEQHKQSSCPVYFGVRSYLHHFYDKSASYKDPKVYEDDDDEDMYLMHPTGSAHTYTPPRRCCSPIWWKVFMCVGVHLLFFGMVGILVGYLVSPRAVVVGENKGAGELYIDPGASRYNSALDVCKLTGLVLFCVGGLTLALSLLFPSFIHRCHDDNDDIGGSVLDSTRDLYVGRGGGGGKTPLSPVELSIPATAHVKNVQPACKAPCSLLTQPAQVVYMD